MYEHVIVSRELHRPGGGGIGGHLPALARTLGGCARITVVTQAAGEPRRRELARSGDDGSCGSVRFLQVEDTSLEAGTYFNSAHAWSAGAYEAIKRAFPAGGPDLVEFQAADGEGAVTAQASASGDPALANTRVCVRLNATAEIRCVLDGSLDDEWEQEITFELERLALRHADWLLWAGGDVLESYRRYYGADALARAVRVRWPIASALSPAPATQIAPIADGRARDPLRLLYLGRLERRKGVQNLLRAVTALDGDWRLTVVGADTGTAPLRLSMRRQLELMADGDPRISFLDAVDHRWVAQLVLEHHVTVVPSLWDGWPAVALESLRLGRPVLATPTGGLTEIVSAGRSGWLAAGTDDDALVAAIDHLCHHRQEVAELIASDRPQRHALALADPREVRRGYEQIVGLPRRVAHRRRSARSPLVSVVIAYHRLHSYVEEAVASIFAQTHHPLEVILVNDGSFWASDQVLAELAARLPLRVLTQVNCGPAGARNAGIAQARGRYVFPMDADNVAEPEFVARCVEVLEADRAIPYATTWSRFIDERGAPDTRVGGGYHPLGNASRLVAQENVAGDTAAVLRRSLFDRGYSYSPDMHSCEDWLLYRTLAQDGRFGVVIPQALMRYRRRPDSQLQSIGVPYARQLINESRALAAERRGEWTRWRA